MIPDQMDAYEYLERVNDRSSFLAFVRALGSEAAGESDDWQNGSVSSYLEAAAAWMEDSADLQQPSWRDFAQFLYAGKIYE
jgi:hypothetical protein